MYSEDDLLPLSGLQHLMFCERQWGLIHIEQIWEENRLTAEGRVLHERAHEPGSESRPKRAHVAGAAFTLVAARIVGQADVVEFHRCARTASLLPEMEGLWRPFPVEYKRGRPKRDACDEVQLCAQALCLEEMFGCQISEGALYLRRAAEAHPGRFRQRTSRADGSARRAHARTVPRRDDAARGVRAQMRRLLIDREVPAATSGQASGRGAILGAGAGRGRGLT